MAYTDLDVLYTETNTLSYTYNNTILVYLIHWKIWYAILYFKKILWFDKTFMLYVTIWILLQIIDASNVIVVVSRWYGGILLGPDRFKHINNAARQICDQCGYIKGKVRLCLIYYGAYW